MVGITMVAKDSRGIALRRSPPLYSCNTHPEVMFSLLEEAEHKLVCIGTAQMNVDAGVTTVQVL